MQSYPFLAIANKYGLDYGDVLMVADHWRRQIVGTESERTTPSLHNALLWPHEALGEITFANSDFRAIQLGWRDWQTGEPIKHPNGAPMFAPDNTMLDDKGNRSIFDDVDEPGEHQEVLDALKEADTGDEMDYGDGRGRY